MKKSFVEKEFYPQNFLQPLDSKLSTTTRLFPPLKLEEKIKNLEAKI